MQQSEGAVNVTADIVEDEYSKVFAPIEHASAGEATDITCRALIEHVSAGTTNDTIFASVVDRLTGNMQHAQPKCYVTRASVDWRCDFGRCTNTNGHSL